MQYFFDGTSSCGCLLMGVLFGTRAGNLTVFILKMNPYLSPSQEVSLCTIYFKINE